MRSAKPGPALCLGFSTISLGAVMLLSEQRSCGGQKRIYRYLMVFFSIERPEAIHSKLSR